MTTVGAYEAKTQLPRLLARVARGEKFVITRHGKPVAMLTPPVEDAEKDVRQVVRDMLAFRDQDGPTLGGKVTVRELIDEGRRC
jgi:prevent-host-death family protein